MIRTLIKRLRSLRRPSDTEIRQLKAQLLANLEALERREFTLKKLQEIAKIGSWEYLVDEDSLICSDEIFDIAGVDKDVDLKDPVALVPLLGAAMILVVEMYRHLLATGQNIDITLQVRTPLGYVKWVNIHAFPVVTDGRVTGVSGMVHDITRFKEAEDLIRANELKYRSFFEQASDAIMVTDMRGSLLNVNESLCKMVGYSKEELLRMNLGQLIDPEELIAEPVRFDTLAEGGHIFRERRFVHKDGSIVLVEANAKMFSENRIMAITRDIRERKQIEAEKDYARYLLRERIKELTTLYRSSQLLSQNQKNLPEVLQETVSNLPGGWQYPTICEARICYAGKEYTTVNFREGGQTQRAEFTIQNEKGSVEVVYLENKPEEVEGPFLFEERTLINGIAEMLQIYVSRKREEEGLNKAKANLESTINNTEILIWSVDRNFCLLSFNRAFAAYVREKFGLEVRMGERIFENAGEDGVEARRRLWKETYLRVLSGEAITSKYTEFGIDFNVQLSPIIEGDLITGISAFADDVTERNQRNRDLAEANKKISELKVMALRSVMNPHFIFNVLNSIQYFIVKNDRLNAVNYLSTFSKLIRNVLTYSLNDKIRLSDEIEMLKDYIELEKVRFEDKFEFSIEIEENLDTDHVLIPSLLIQPFAENAILHGLYNKHGNGQLTIRIREAGEYVVFEVEDDGVGRETAARLRQLNPTKHNSVGTKLTEERLRLIDQKPGVSVEFEDLHHEGQPSGTKVKIRVKTF